jgi:hypothetical protein
MSVIIKLPEIDRPLSLFHGIPTVVIVIPEDGGNFTKL